jgi:hypothetical protein
MKKQLCLLLVCVALAGRYSDNTQAAVIYSDTFTRVTGSGDPNGNPAGVGNGFSSWGTNDNALGGTISQAYFVGPTNRTGGANQTTDGSRGTLISGGTMFGFDVTTVAPNGFSVAFEFNRFHPINPGTGNGFVAVGFGKAVPADPNTYGGLGAIGGSDFAILFQQSAGGNLGNTQFFQDDAGTATTFLPGTGATGPLDYGSPTGTHSVLIEFTPVILGAYGSADTINFEITVDGSASFASSLLGGDNFGNLAFSANPSVHRYIDNLVVSAIPEPASILLLGLSVLGTTSIRRI